MRFRAVFLWCVCAFLLAPLFVNVFHAATIPSGIRFYPFVGYSSNRPIYARVLEVDLYDFSTEVRPALAWDRIGRVETLVSLANRNNALAGLNGSFFDRSGKKYPVGYVMINGELVYKSDIRRACFGLTNLRYPVFGYFKPYIKIREVESGREFYVSGVNRPRPLHGIVIYSSYFGERTQTGGGGWEAILKKNKRGSWKVEEVRGYNSSIPPGGYVLSCAAKNKRYASLFKPGKEIRLDVYIPPEWSQVIHLITGGPMLVKKGVYFVRTKEEGFRGGILVAKVRTAVGYTHQDKLLLVVATRSSGLSFGDMAKLMLQLGAREAMGLDSGSSSSLYVGGRIVSNSQGWTRPIANGLLVFKHP